MAQSSCSARTLNRLKQNCPDQQLRLLLQTRRTISQRTGIELIGIVVDVSISNVVTIVDIVKLTAMIRI